MIEFYSFETELITKLQTRRLAMQNHGVCYPWFSLLLFFCILVFIPSPFNQLWWICQIFTNASDWHRQMLMNSFMVPVHQLFYLSNQEYVSTTQAKNYSIISTQWHLEVALLQSKLSVKTYVLYCWCCRSCWSVGALEHLLLCFWNQIATCIWCFDFLCCRCCWCVFWAVVSLFNVNMRLYLLFWAAKIWYVFWAVMIILVYGMRNWIELMSSIFNEPVLWALIW